MSHFLPTGTPTKTKESNNHRRLLSKMGFTNHTQRQEERTKARPGRELLSGWVKMSC